MNHIFFIENISLIDLDNESTFVAEIYEIDSEIELFSQLKNNFHFPDYYGYNWNATYECLTDFHWLESINHISLIHNCMLNIDKNTLLIYMNVLEAVVNYWNINKEKIFDVFFLKGMEEKLSL